MPPTDGAGRRAVVTGGAGFLGRAFTQRLVADGWDGPGVDVRPGPRVITGDVTRPGPWADVLGDADLVVHTAALLGDIGDARSHWDVNVGGTRTVAELAAAAGVGRLLHLSSIVVLGDDFPDGADETHPVRMTHNPYTDTKVAAEHVALSIAAKGLPLTIVRPGDVYGPHSAQWTVRAVTLIRKGLFVLVDGGTGIMSPVFVDDLVDGALAAGTAEAGRGEIFHVTGGVGVPAADFFGRYAEMLGRSLRSVPRYAARSLTAGAERVMRPLGVAPPLTARALEYVTHPGTYSIAKARDVLGWEPSVSLDEGMARTRAWLQDVGLLD